MPYLKQNTYKIEEDNVVYHIIHDNYDDISEDDVHDIVNNAFEDISY